MWQQKNCSTTLLAIYKKRSGGARRHIRRKSGVRENRTGIGIAVQGSLCGLLPCGKKAAERIARRVIVNFKELLIQAKSGDKDAEESILALYKPLLIKESILDGTFDEDLYQELCITLLNCIRKFII